MLKHLCVIGVGLMGGSVARAARLAYPGIHIMGYGRSTDIDNLTLALKLGVIDDFSLEIEQAVKASDCVVIATPVGTYTAVFKLLKPFWSSTTVYTDTGSTKSSVLDACIGVFGAVPENFVPAHPIAGAEQSGVEAARADLFAQKGLILTPANNCHEAALKFTQDFWAGLGAQVSIMSAEQHDAILAATSHLPHILAFALVNLLGRKDERADIFKYAAGGFKDFTRIASSDPIMWQDICMANKDQLVPLIEELKNELTCFQSLIQDENSAALFQAFQYANQARSRFLEQFEKTNVSA